MHLVQLETFKNQDIGVTLRHLLARYEAGELRGIAVCIKDHLGKDTFCLTGQYRTHPELALGAALRLSRRINEMSG